MYEAVTAYPDGASTTARLAQIATRYGFDGIVVRNGADIEVDTEGIRRTYEIDIVDGVEIRTDDLQRASGIVGNYRPSTTMLIAVGGTITGNRFACENEYVDVLSRPLAGDGDINHVMTNAAADNGVRLEVDLTPVLRSQGGRRVRAIQKLRKLVELIEHSGAPYVVSATPQSHLELRAPRELTAVGDAIGLEAAFISDGLAEWGRLADRNRQIHAESFIEPGVERGQYEK